MAETSTPAEGERGSMLSGLPRKPNLTCSQAQCNASAAKFARPDQGTFMAGIGAVGNGSKRGAIDTLRYAQRPKQLYPARDAEPSCAIMLQTLLPLWTCLLSRP